MLQKNGSSTHVLFMGSKGRNLLCFWKVTGQFFLPAMLMNGESQILLSSWHSSESWCLAGCLTNWLQRTIQRTSVDRNQVNSFNLNLHPGPCHLGQAYVQTIGQGSWRKSHLLFLFLYWTYGRHLKVMAWIIASGCISEGIYLSKVKWNNPCIFNKRTTDEVVLRLQLDITQGDSCWIPQCN